MNLYDDFMNTGKEVYEVTQNDWLNIMHDQHVNRCGRSEQEFNKVTTQEVKLFHKEQVRMALKKGIAINENVLADYPTLRQEIEKKVKEEQELYNNQIVFTQDLYNTLQQGNKITVNGAKLTVYDKTNNSIVARLYRKQKQAVELLINSRYNSFTIGWSE